MGTGLTGCPWWKWATRRQRARGGAIPGSALMENGIVTGIGNIYASEILFAAGVDPRRAGASLTGKECGRIADEAKRILRRAIECGGSAGHKWRIPLAVVLPRPARGAGTLIPSAQRLVWANLRPGPPLCPLSAPS